MRSPQSAFRFWQENQNWKRLTSLKSLRKVNGMGVWTGISQFLVQHTHFKLDWTFNFKLIPVALLNFELVLNLAYKYIKLTIVSLLFAAVPVHLPIILSMHFLWIAALHSAETTTKRHLRFLEVFWKGRRNLIQFVMRKLKTVLF